MRRHGGGAAGLRRAGRHRGAPLRSGRVRALASPRLRARTERRRPLPLRGRDRRPGRPHGHPAPNGYGPTDLQSAYNIFTQSSTAGGTQTIAIVDAYDDPNAEADLGVYRSQYGLPPCTTANGCFKKVNQQGQQSNYPATNAGWAQEISLDLDMASAICPNCKLLLVEANSNFFSDLAAAVDRAATLNATQISNSYGGGEYSGETSDESHYNHPGVAVTVSSGDSGYDTEAFSTARRCALSSRLF